MSEDLGILERFNQLELVDEAFVLGRGVSLDSILKLKDVHLIHLVKVFVMVIVVAAGGSRADATSDLTVLAEK